MEEELENTKLDLEALRIEADVLLEKGNYQEALDNYLRLDLDKVSDKIVACYLLLGRIDLAIEYSSQVIEKLKEEDSSTNSLFYIYLLRGIAYYLNSKNETNYKKAIDDFLEYLKFKSEDKNTNRFIGDCYLNLDDVHNAVEYFIKANVDVLELMKQYKNSKLISLMLDAEIQNKDNPTLFSKAISDGGIEDINSNEYKAYKKIYIKVIEIIALLHVNNENEKSVAHYTRINIAERLIFEGSPFRLNTILTANDPKEGLDLFEFLNLNQTDNDVSSDFQAFIGSFTFNHDSLNQFRLYGKENDKEATGISLVLNEKFFNGSIVSCVNPSCILDDKRNDDDMSDKKSLFRCIYVDPVSKQLISIGQREMWTFYREKREDIMEADSIIKTYKKETDKIFKSIKDKLNKLKGLICKLGDNKKVNVLSELLLMLRYLTKNMAFKEEQECRVMAIENIANNQKILPEKKDNDFSHMYINYHSVKGCIEKVYFAPKAKGQEIFNIHIKRFCLNIRSHESTHKIS